MALALADSIAQAGWDLNDQARRYVSWWRTGAYSVNGRCFDIGLTTADALHRFQQHQDAGLDRDEVLAADWEPLQQLRRAERLHSELDAVALGSFRQLQPPAIKGSGYVVKSLEAALWAFHDARDFRVAVLRAVNLGDDADTTGAVCGQLAGAFWGERQIPQQWLDGLAKRKIIDTALDGLLGDTTRRP